MCKLLFTLVGVATAINSIQITQPNGPANYATQNKPIIVKWESYGSQTLRLEYSMLESDITKPIVWTTAMSSIPASWGNIGWVPTFTGSGVRIRLVDEQDRNVYDLNDGFIYIQPGPNQIKVESPNGGETWYAGDSLRNIELRSKGTFMVELSYSTDAKNWYKLTNETVYSIYGLKWSIPRNFVCEPCLIRARDIMDTTVVDYMDQVFRVIQNPNLTPVANVNLNRNMGWTTSKGDYDLLTVDGKHNTTGHCENDQCSIPKQNQTLILINREKSKLLNGGSE